MLRGEEGPRPKGAGHNEVITDVVHLDTFAPLLFARLRLMDKCAGKLSNIKKLCMRHVRLRTRRNIELVDVAQQG